MFEHLSMHWGYRTVGHLGVTKQEQVRTLSSYFHLLSASEVKELWYIYNKNEWFDLRRKIIDKYMPAGSALGWWHSDKMMTILDETLNESRPHWLHHRIDEFLKADVAWNDILTSMTVWLEQKHSLDALNVVASALAYRGTRNDLAVLKNYEDMGDAAVEIITDTIFAVCRRSLR